MAKSQMNQDMRDKVDALSECARALGVPAPAPGRVDSYLRLLADVSAKDFRRALDAHMNHPDRGRFFPTIADIRAQLPQAKHKPMNADEAWAIALTSFDESASVVWSTVIEEARNIALPIWLEGDAIGARMAFKGAYDRLMLGGAQPAWRLSVGHDPARRQEAVNSAIAAGLITHEQGRALLPAPPAIPEVAAVAGLLVGKVVPFPVGAGEGVKRLRDAIESATRAANQRAETRVAEQRQAEESRRADLAQQADALSRGEKS